ncbi:MAG: amidase family protein [Pseudomonadota bacterium]
MSDPLWRLSACDMAAGIRARRFTCVDVMEAVVARIRALNPEINAIVYDHSDDALAAAEQAHRAVAEGATLGPLHGVPVTIKENVDVKGQPTPNGMAALEHIIAPDDAPLVRNLRDAGAIVVGRTNTPELSMRATTDNPLHGRTLNPWDHEASPGGSSGGGSAAAAAGFGPIHHGNDIGGSLRFPSFACGLASVKPTNSRVPAWNPSQTAERGLLAQLMSVQGAMCREVRDVRLAMRTMIQGDPRDPWWVPVPFDGPPLPQPIKVGFTKETYGYPIHAEISAALDRAAAHLQDAGYAVEEVATPSIEQAANEWFDVAVHEIKETLEPIVLEHGSDTIKRIFENMSQLGDVIGHEDYGARVAARSTLTRAWNVFLADYPLVLAPFMMRPLYGWNYDQQGLPEMRDIFRAAIYSPSINYLSLPAGIVPTGLADGLPAGVQIIGQRYREDLILDAMEAIEQREGVLNDVLWQREQEAAAER